MEPTTLNTFWVDLVEHVVGVLCLIGQVGEHVETGHLTEVSEQCADVHVGEQCFPYLGGVLEPCWDHLMGEPILVNSVDHVSIGRRLAVTEILGDFVSLDDLWQFVGGPGEHGLSFPAGEVCASPVLVPCDPAVERGIPAPVDFL